MRAASDRRIPTESSPPMEPHLGEDVREPHLVTHLPMDGWNVDNTHTDDPDQAESDFRVRLQGRTDESVSRYVEPHLGEDVREPQLVTHLPMDGWNVDNTQTDDPDQTESDFRVRLQGRTDDLVSGYVTTRPLKQYDPSEGDEWSRPLGAAAAQTDGERITTLSETQPTTMEGGIP